MCSFSAVGRELQRKLYVNLEEILQHYRTHGRRSIGDGEIERRYGVLLYGARLEAG
jgi:hypothetical protein